MGWQLKIFNPSGVTLKQTCDDINPAGVVGGFEWELKPNGDCVQLRFNVKANAMQFLEDDRVEFFEGGSRVFYGSVAALPDPTDENEKTVTIVGARESLKLIFPARRRFLNVADVATIITRNPPVSPVPDANGLVADRGGYKEVLPSHVNYNAAKIESNLGPLRQWDFALTKFDQILDRISAAVLGANGPVSWGVDADRDLFLKSNNATGTPAGYELSRLERTNDGIVTRVVVPVAQNPSTAYTITPPRSTQIITTYGTGGYAFRGDPIVIDTQDAAHSTYNRTVDVALGLVDPLQEIGYFLGGVVAVPNPGYVYDGNAATFAAINPVAPYYEFEIGGYIDTNADDVCGLDITYSTLLATDSYRLELYWRNMANGNVPAAFRVILAGTGEHTQNRVRIYAKKDGGVSTRVDFYLTKLNAQAQPVADALRIYTIQLLRIHPSAIQYAKSFIKLPEPVIARAVVPGRFGPFPRVILGGTTYKASAYRYKLVELEGTVGLETVIDIGQREQSPASRVVNAAMRELDRRDLSDARAYVDTKATLQ